MYISKLDDPYSLVVDFRDIRDELAKLLPSMANPADLCYENESPIDEFLNMFATLERLLFEEVSTLHTPTKTYKYHSNQRNIFNEILDYYRVGQFDYASGFVLINSPQTRFEDHTEYKHLTAAESTFKKNSHHFLKIFTISDKCLVIFTNKQLSFETILKLKMLQWSITKDNIETPVPQILEILQALLDKDLDKLNTLFTEIFNMEKLITIKYDKVKALFKPNYKRRIDQLRADINGKENDFRYYEEQLRAIAIKINDMETELEATVALSEKKETEDNDYIIKYLMKHPYIKEFGTSSRENKIDLYYEAPITYYDEYVLENITKNHIGKKKRILQAFLDNKYELMVIAKIAFNPDTFGIGSYHMNNTPYLGHPHIDRYGCYGNHETEIYNAARNMNFLGAIDQISQMVLNLNFSDGTVVREMLHILTSEPFYSTVKTWRHKETGVLVTTEELLEVYNEETSTDS